MAKRDSERLYKQRMLSIQAVIKAMEATSANVPIERDACSFKGVVAGRMESIHVFPYAIDTTRGRFGGVQGIDKKCIEDLRGLGDPLVAWADHVTEECVWARLSILLADGTAYDDKGRPVAVPIEGSKGGRAPGATPQLLWPQHYIKKVGGWGPMSPELAAELRTTHRYVSKAGKKRQGNEREERHNYKQSEAAARDWQNQQSLLPEKE